jgi:hypothetical protein
MARRLFFTVMVLIAGTGLLQAQSTNITLGDFYRNFKGSQYNRMFDEKNEIIGSPYENSQFEPGEIFTNTQQHFSGILLRYNMNSNQMEFKRPEGDIFEISPADMIDSVLIGSSKYIYAACKSGSKSLKGYFKVLAGGTPALLLRMNVILKAAEPAAPYKEPVPASFERRPDEFYLLPSAGEAVKLSGKKDLLEILTSHTDEMEQFIKNNKVKFNKQEDLVSLMQYYNSLAK